MDDERAQEVCMHVGGLGGWMTEDNTWQQWVMAHTNYEEAAFALRTADRIFWPVELPTGKQNQNGNLEDFLHMPCGHTPGFSWRAWGDFMAAVHHYRTGEGSSYMRFYM